jgi:hypothetical protein
MAHTSATYLSYPNGRRPCDAIAARPCPPLPGSGRVAHLSSPGVPLHPCLHAAACRAPPPIPFFSTPPTSIKGGTQRLLLPFAPMPFLHHVLRKPSPHQPPYLSSTTDRRRTAATTGLGATVAAIATPIVSSTTWSSLPSIRLCFLLSSLSRSSRAHPRSSPATGALSPLRQHRRATAIGTSTPLSYLSEDLTP